MAEARFPLFETFGQRSGDDFGTPSEPTSSLDRETEESLRTVLAELARERNVVVVTHSPILLAACNNIVAMDRGHISMAGPAHEIMPKLFGGRRQGPPLERRK